ncbi:MAG TPA: hypothetical protein PKJ41_17845 [Bryobacteraceae bacterium]|nr:hypothetical protein [Bryobacteraceae bacterium]
MIANEKGVFVFLSFDAMHSWDTLLTLAAPELDRRGLQRLQAVLAPHSQAVVIERHYIDKDYRDTFSQFHSKRFNTPSSRCLRLHFFRKAVGEDSIVAGGDEIAKAYLGYVVIRPTKPNCVGRTLLSSAVRFHQKAHLSVCEESVLLLGTRLKVIGFPFISQDADATVCAQSALWMLLRYYSTRYAWYSEILPFQITNLANHHALGSRVYPSSGLYSWQLAEALRLQRFAPVVYSRNQYPATFDHLLYTYIESGLPLLITVPGHVIVGYGHVSSYDRPWPPGPPVGHLYSSYFNAAWCISDDNKFPYQTLRAAGSSETVDSEFGWPQIEEFIVPLPEKVFLTAEQVQAAIERLWQDPYVGVTAQSPALAERRLIFRLYLTSSRSFKRHLHERGMGNPTVETIYLNLPMPHFVWICEVADFDAYAAKHEILGEVIWDATRNAHEPNGWVALHYPEKLLVDTGSAFNHSQQRITEFPLEPISCYSLFSSNLSSL